jgi:hypothetical protein
MPAPQAAKPEPIFELIFKGSAIYPWSIPISKVMGALSAVRRLAAGEVLAEEDEEEEEEADKSITLLDVKKGSAVFRFTGQSPTVAINRLREAGKILHNPETASQGEFILRPIKDLSAIARSLECSIVIKEPGKGSSVYAEVDEKSYEAISKSLLLSGETSIVGRVLRVGGATALRCGMRVPFQSRMLFCRVQDQELARKLGDCLYQHVVVAGSVRWLKGSMRVFSFTIREVHQPKSKSILESLDSIWQSGMSDWAKLDDPDGYLQEVRGTE